MHKIKKISLVAILALILMLWLIIVVFPFIYMILTSFKKQPELYGSSPFALPQSFMLDNYKEILSGNFLNYFKNSVLIVAISLILLLAISSMASYVFARLRYKLNKALFTLVMACMTIPIHVTLIPVFLLSKKIDIYNTPWALIGPYIAFNLPISIFILSGFMREIPRELEEAAEIDGSSKVGIFLRIIIPLSVPGITTLAIYNGINMWNEFIYALTLTTSVKSRTLPLAIWEYQGQYGINVTMIMTILTLSALPMIIMFIICQEKLIKGMIVGAVKG